MKNSNKSCSSLQGEIPVFLRNTNCVTSDVASQNFGAGKNKRRTEIVLESGLKWLKDKVRMQVPYFTSLPGTFCFAFASVFYSLSLISGNFITSCTYICKAIIYILKAI